MTGGAEPEGLGMSLDDLISKKAVKPAGGPGRGGGRGLAAQGGVQKPLAARGGRGSPGRSNDGGGRGGPSRGAFVGGRGGGRTAGNDGFVPGERGAPVAHGPSVNAELIQLRAQVATQQQMIMQQQQQILHLTQQLVNGVAPIGGRPNGGPQGGVRQNRAPVLAPEPEPEPMDPEILSNMEVGRPCNHACPCYLNRRLLIAAVVDTISST
jgi:hypothetical protein